MKNNGKQIKCLAIILLAVGLSGCSWFGDSSEPVNDSYEAGKKAFSEGNYEEAKSYFRKVTLSSSFYPQAIRMIQKVPFKKGVAAYEQKQFQVAISELSKVPVHSPDYAETQHYLKLSNYALLHKQFTKSSGKDRFVLISEMVKIASELGDSKLLLESVDLIDTGLDQSTSTSQTRDLLNLLDSIVAVNKDPEVYKKALNYLLTDFEQLYKRAEVRTDVFRIIGNLKMELM
tara:strand:- start:15 stop:707 length:693 start_codon:yes stop_codon:yes gene_type:complete